MLSDEALIIFIKNPVLGKVKTRLAQTIGDVQALSVYNQLLQQTHNVTSKLTCERFLFYSDFIDENDLWENHLFHKNSQLESADLGKRMQHAFDHVFKKGFKKVMIIGSDCPELTTTILKEGLEQLTTHDYVIGPAIDGGYYLLGIKAFRTDIFKNKEWSTSKVYSSTVENFNQTNSLGFVLPILSDVDTEDDLKSHNNKKST